MVCETPFLGLVSPFDSFLFLRAVHFSCIEWWREGSDADARIATHLMAARPSHRRLRLSDLLAVRISAELLALQNTYGPCTSFLFQVHTCKYKHTLSHTHTHTPRGNLSGGQLGQEEEEMKVESSHQVWPRTQRLQRAPSSCRSTSAHLEAKRNCCLDVLLGAPAPGRSFFLFDSPV